MKVFWTADAIQDRLDIWEYIARDNQDAASNMDQLFSIAATWLTDYSSLGKSGKIQGTRELIPHENYRLVYEINDETVWILALIHTSRQWP
jgi:addiction module RelE/StbE family toxin